MRKFLYKDSRRQAVSKSQLGLAVGVFFHNVFQGRVEELERQLTEERMKLETALKDSKTKEAELTKAKDDIMSQVCHDRSLGDSRQALPTFPQLLTQTSCWVAEKLYI